VEYLAGSGCKSPEWSLSIAKYERLANNGNVKEIVGFEAK
jgi:hypothetical protein